MKPAGHKNAPWVKQVAGTEKNRLEKPKAGAKGKDYIGRQKNVEKGKSGFNGLPPICWRGGIFGSY